MRNFELFMCCLGNGVTVCNKAVKEHGDYKYIAHISPAGNITMYVSDDYIPKENMQTIQRVADENKMEFSAKFETLPKIKQYEIILDTLPYSKFRYWTNDKRPYTEKLPLMREEYYKLA